MKNRIKKPAFNIEVPTTREQAQWGVNQIAMFANLLRQEAAAMDAQIHAIRETHSEKIDRLNEQLKGYTDALQAWAEAHPEEFARRKSIDFAAGVVGFRTGTPKLKPVAKWTFERVLESLRQMTGGPQFIRVKEEVDKEALLGAGLKAEELNELGVQIVQEESFYVEPKLTVLEMRQTAVAA